MKEAELEAFVEAYRDNVAVASSETVRSFIKDHESDMDGNEIYEKYGCDYTSIFDAWGVWNCALAFAKENAEKV